MANILIVDDDTSLCYVLTRTVQKMGHTAVSCHSLAEARSLLLHIDFDVVLLDVCLPDGSGLAEIQNLSGNFSQPDVIVITGRGIPEDAEQAIRDGAWDYLQKASPRHMAATLEQVLRYRGEKLATRRSVAPTLQVDGIVGQSPQLRLCLDSLLHMAKGEASILLCGETGTGKEAFARALHNNSLRSPGPFVVVDCASLPDNLVESLLFGHVRGAFTGAERDMTGLVRQADGGTLFLDEVGELPLPAQAAFLRVLQQRTFRRVGGTQEEFSDFRLVAATNRNLDDMVGEGAFRPDLLFRLRGACLFLPPLRQREGDVPLITAHYVAQLCERLGVENKTLSPEFLAVLEEYPWPGNVRELLNALEFAVNAARQEPTLFHAHLPRELRAHTLRRRMTQEDAPPAMPSSASPGMAPPLTAPSSPQPSQTHALAGAEPSSPELLPPLAQYREQALHRIERAYIEELMRQTANDIPMACAIAGLSQSRLYALLKKYTWRTTGWHR